MVLRSQDAVVTLQYIIILLQHHHPYHPVQLLLGHVIASHCYGAVNTLGMPQHYTERLHHTIQQHALTWTCH